MSSASLRIFTTTLLALLFSLTSCLVLGKTTPKDIHLEKSLYRNILVSEEDGMRCIRLNKRNGGQQSCISLTDPNLLVLNYTKMMMGALYLNPSPQHILIIGLGGGSLPTTLHKLFPSAQIDSVEIDPAIVKVAIKFFGFIPSENLKVYEEDGRIFVKRAGKRHAKYDLIMLDAYTDEYIPEHMLTQEFLTEVRKLLADKGVLAANTHSNSGLYNLESATYYKVFGDFYNLTVDNRIILTRNGGLPDKNEVLKNAKLLDFKLRHLGIGLYGLYPLFKIEKNWPTNTKILTDQYSPSNLLNAK